jgi:hypothetical protein
MRTRRTWWRSPGLCGPLLAVTALAALAQPAAAFSPGGNGADVTCTAGPASVTTACNTPKQITGTGTLQCPAPGNNSPGGFGPTGGATAVGTPPQPVDGTPCKFVYTTPVLLRYPGVGPEFQQMEPANIIAPDSTPNFVTVPWKGANFGVSTVNNPFPSNYITGDQWYYSAGFEDWYTTWTYNGTWKKQADGSFKCMALNNGGWSMRCSGTSLIVQCFDPVQRAVVAAGPLPVTALGFDLRAFLQGLVGGGTISSVPDNPRPGLTNIATCFYVNGMTINNQPANLGQDVFWEQIVPGPPVDAQGRRIYFVFVIHVSYRGTEWDFGDGPTSTVPLGGPLDSRCPPPTGTQQAAASHTYNRYSTGDGFHVTVTHHFGVDVNEVWTDTNNLTNHAPVPGIPDLTVPGNPQPFFAKQIVQEEGVPVG